MITILLLLGLLGIILVMGKFNLSYRFKRQVKKLFAQSNDISVKTFTHAQLKDLPEPVLRYFHRVLKEGQPYIRYARITHTGLFKAGVHKDWARITGEQYATTVKPGFIWKGKTSFFTARDMYIADKGRLTVTIFSLFNVVDATGETYDQGELLRWLGESILYPTNLLPDERLTWSPIDRQTARLTFEYNGLSLFYLVTFNDVGEITQLETKRYMDKHNLESWIIKAADYKDVQNVLVPTTFEVLWRLQKGDLSYAKFKVKNVEYNKPEIF